MGKIKTLILSWATVYNSSPVLSKTLGIVATIIFVISAVLSTFYAWKAVNDSPENIKAYYTKSEFPGVVAYSGEIRNEDDLNADDFSFKGEFQFKVAKFEVNTPDVIEKKDENIPPGVVQFLLKRLSKGNQCEFDILVEKGNERKGEMQISWKGGKGHIELKEMDKNFKRGIKLSEEVRGLELSQKARSKWIDNNTKVIGVLK